MKPVFLALLALLPLAACAPVHSAYKEMTACHYPGPTKSELAAKAAAEAPQPSTAN